MPFTAAESEKPCLLPGGRQSVTFPLMGMVMAGGAPLGLLLLRRFVLRQQTPVREEIERDLPTYLYLATATTFVFAILGRIVGRYADRLAELSTTDSLTALLNPRGFYPRLELEVERARRSHTPLSLVLLDLDHLKELNDACGHDAGDKALGKIADAIRQEMRTIDVGARLGGDEFCVLATGAGETAASALAQRLRHAVAGEMSELPGVPMSVSVGVVTFEPARHALADVRELTQAADRAMYAAKQGGRNRVAIGTLTSRTDGGPR